MSDNLFLLRRYVDFMFRAKSRYGVHSPYIYQLIEKVIRPGSPAGLCSPVEEVRRKMLKDKRVIQKTDHGSGSHHGHALSYPVRIDRLAHTSSLPTSRASRLFNLVRFLDASNIIELGTSLGISAAYMAKAGPKARIITLEGCPEIAELARMNMEALGLYNVHVVTGPFQDKLQEALNNIKPADLVFIDGDHREGPTVEYFLQCLPYTHEGTAFVIDDIHRSKGMEKAWGQICAHPEVRVSIDLFHQGWILLKKELSRQQFVLRYP